MSIDPLKRQVTLYLDHWGTGGTEAVEDHPAFVAMDTPRTEFFRDAKGALTIAEAYAFMGGCWIAEANDEFLRRLLTVTADETTSFSIEADEACYVARRTNEPFHLPRSAIGEDAFRDPVDMTVVAERDFPGIVGRARIASAVLASDGARHLHVLVDREGASALVELDVGETSTPDLLVHLAQEGMLEATLSDLSGLDVAKATYAEMVRRATPWQAVAP